MGLPCYRVESVIGYRNVLRHGLRGKTRYGSTVAAQDKIGARVQAEEALLSFFRRKYGHLEIKSLVSKVGPELPLSVIPTGDIQELEVLA